MQDLNMKPKTSFSCPQLFDPEMAVALQFRVLQSAIEFIKTTANQEPQKSSSSVNAPSSPHHAIYQKRKSIAGECAEQMLLHKSDLKSVWS